MKILVLILLVTSTVGFGHAIDNSTLVNIPTCATRCIPPHFRGSTCLMPDLPCFCNQRYFLSFLSVCLYKKCDAEDGALMHDITSSVCDIQYQDESGTAIAVSACFGAISTIFVLLRLTEHRPFTKSFYLDDLFIIIAQTFNIAMIVLCACATMFGYGKTQFGVAVQNLSSILKIFWVVRVAYCLVNTFTKLSILTLYLRVFQSNRFKWHVLIVMALTAAYGITFTFIPLFQCRPISYYWLQWDYELRGTCIPGNIYIWTSAAFNISLDIIVILLPIRQVMLLNLKLGKKLQIVGMFCVGFFITIASIIRLALNLRLSDDNTLGFVPLIIWSTVEVSTAVECACLPAIAGMFRRIRRQCTHVSDSDDSRNESRDERTAVEEENKQIKTEELDQNQ